LFGLFDEEKIPFFAAKYLVKFSTERISSNKVLRNQNYIKRSLTQNSSIARF
jgi:hypothetical protein